MLDGNPEVVVGRILVVEFAEAADVDATVVGTTVVAFTVAM